MREVRSRVVVRAEGDAGIPTFEDHRVRRRVEPEAQAIAIPFGESFASRSARNASRSPLRGRSGIRGGTPRVHQTVA